MKYIDQVDLKSKRVFIRADLDVPLDDQGKVADDNRIRASVSTIEHALAAGARVIVAGHSGRPKGQVNPALSLKPMAEHLGTLIKKNVGLAPGCVGPEVESLVEKLAPGEVLMLENLRFHAEEEKNDPAFSEQLGRLCDVYVNNAFATSHRAHASIEGITKYVKEKAAGFTLKDELTSFSRAFDNPARPLAAIFGGAKVSTKIEALRHVAPKTDILIVGGAMANTFLAAQGHKVGRSLYEQDQVEAARQILDEAKAAGRSILVPVDVVVAAKLESGVPTKVVDVDSIGGEDLALDIGPKTLAAFAKALDAAKTISWNGPMGAFETAEFSAGTFGLIDALAALKPKAFTVVGGGDTDYALHQKHAFDKMGYVSTAGGAFLELLEGKNLPGIVALG